MKISKSLKHSVLGICCSLGLSGFAYSQNLIIQGPPADEEFAPTISVDDDNNVSIVATNDSNMNVQIVTDVSQVPRYSIEVIEEGILVYFAWDFFFAPNSGEQINNLSITTGRGNDDVFIAGGNNNVQVTGDLTIDTRNGNDRVVVRGVDVMGRTSIRGRAGTDRLLVGRLSADSLYIGGGPGDSDEVSISSSVITNRVSFSGGRGSGDLIDASGNDFRQTPRVVNFESVAD